MGKKIAFLLALLFLLISCKGQNTMIDKTVVSDLDIEKYLGTWYELARYDHKFERGLVGVTANYSLREDGKYAFRFFHDENSNGKLGTNWLGIPNEGFGFSNNAKGTFGPPAFEKTVFVLKGVVNQKCTPQYY